MTAISEGERGVNVGILVSSKTRPGHVPGVRTPAGSQSTAFGTWTGTALLGCRKIGPSWVTLGLNWVLDLGLSTYNKYKENTKNKNKHSSLDKIRRLQLPLFMHY